MAIILLRQQLCSNVIYRFVSVESSDKILLINTREMRLAIRDAR